MADDDQHNEDDNEIEVETDPQADGGEVEQLADDTDAGASLLDEGDGHIDADELTSNEDETDKTNPAQCQEGGEPPHEETVKKPRKWLKGFYWLAVIGVWFGIAVGVFALYLAIDLPDLDALPPPGQNDRVEVRANDGSVIVTYGPVHDKPLLSSDIPQVVKQAIIAVEDRRFFEHSGFDIRSFFRAMWTNLSSGGLRQGGSTLSQQLAKNIFLSHQRTVKRKVQELLLALWLEQRYSKDEILTLYLNRVYFGSGAYGIEAASQKFFAHSAKTLNVAEAAMLAGLVKAPSRLSPLRNNDAAVERSHIVLGTMARGQFITEGELEHWKSQPPVISTKQAGGDDRYFTDWILDKLAQIMPERDEPVIIYTSLDKKAQAAAIKALKDGLAGGAGERANIGQGAILALSFDGSVQAMVGGTSYAQSQYNRATQAQRQPGSAFKPFVYLAAVEQGISMNLAMVDEPVNIDGWSPNNFSGEFSGQMSLRQSFARSINTIAVKLSEHVGRERVIETARRLGITTPLRPHPSIALGAFEVRLLELTSAYTVFANGGFKVEPYGILEVRTESGSLVYRREQGEEITILMPESAAKVRSLLRGVIDFGSGRSADVSPEAGGKTGTSQNFRDAWFVGYSGRLTAGVWLGNDDGSPMKRVTGAGLPTRIWAQFMDEVSK